MYNIRLLKCINKTPMSIYQLFSLSLRDSSSLVLLPKITREAYRCNFIFRASTIWNNLSSKLFNKSQDGKIEDGDSTASIPVIKRKLKKLLIDAQKFTSDGCKTEQWSELNFLHPSQSQTLSNHII